MRISVLIGTRNRAGPLVRCLESIALQSLRPHEVVVLDDASDELQVSDVLREAGIRDVRVLRAEHSLGVAAGRNLLFREATGDVFFVLDDDTRLHRADFLEQLSRILEHRPNAAIVATRIVDQPPATPRLRVPFTERKRRSSQVTDREQFVSYFLGGGHAIRREVYATIGGYDDRFVWGEEELDFSYRAIQAGYEIFYSPELVVQHYPMPSVFRAPGRPHAELFYHVRNRLLIAKKYLPGAYIAPYLGIWLCRYALSAFREGTLAQYFRGLISGMRTIARQSRAPLTSKSLSYLRRNHGRLWF